MPAEDKFKDLFNNPNLENEDWLEPGPELLTAITEELYPEEKKRRKFIFILFGVLAFALMSLLLFKPFDKENKKQTSELIQEKIIDTPKSSSDIGSPFKSNSNTEKKTEKNNAADVISQANAPIEKKSKPSIRTKKIIQTKNLSALKNNKNSSSLSNVLSDENYERNIYDDTKQNGTIFNSGLTKNDVPGVSKQKNAFTLLSNPTFLNKWYFDNLPFDRPFVNIGKNHLSTPEVDIEKENKRPWSLTIGSGISIINFILNDNYKSDLNPFDFTHEEGTGYYLSVSSSKQITSKLAFKFSATYENINFDSGHNSIVNYDPDQELGVPQLEYDMGMATPLGFISSEIVIERVSADVSTDKDLTIDLQNTHRIQIIELAGIGEYKLISKDQFNFTPTIGFGASYLMDIKNELVSFSPGNPDFKSSISMITAGQSNLNKLTPFLDLGFNVDYRLKKGIDIGANYRFKKNLQAVFQQDDYNTTMNRQNIGVFMRFNF